MGRHLSMRSEQVIGHCVSLGGGISEKPDLQVHTRRAKNFLLFVVRSKFFQLGWVSL